MGRGADVRGFGSGSARQGHGWQAQTAFVGPSSEAFMTKKVCHSFEEIN